MFSKAARVAARHTSKVPVRRAVVAALAGLRPAAAPAAASAAAMRPHARGLASAKAKKDANRPKRGKSAYIFYSASARERIVKEQPDLKFTEVGHSPARPLARPPADAS